MFKFWEHNDTGHFVYVHMCSNNYNDRIKKEISTIEKYRTTILIFADFVN